MRGTIRESRKENNTLVYREISAHTIQMAPPTTAINSRRSLPLLAPTMLLEGTLSFMQFATTAQVNRRRGERMGGVEKRGGK